MSGVRENLTYESADGRRRRVWDLPGAVLVRVGTRLSHA